MFLGHSTFNILLFIVIGILIAIMFYITVIKNKSSKILGIQFCLADAYFIYNKTYQCRWSNQYIGKAKSNAKLEVMLI